MGIPPGAIVAVPPLSDRELLELAVQAGADASWVSTIRDASRGGHPQLANATVMGLRARGWPPAVCGADVSADLPEIGAEAGAARRRLSAALPGDAERQLVYRISVVQGSFPRAVALALGETVPGLPLPGEAFDAMLGPWVDQVGSDRFRVSPLLAGSGSDVLPPATLTDLHRRVATTLLDDDGVSVDQADNIFHHGLAARADGPLRAVAGAIVRSEVADLWLLEPHLPRLLAAETGRPIAPWSATLSAQLRLAQVLVLSARGVGARAIPPIRRFLAEVRDVPAPGGSRLEVVALGKLLFRDGLSRHMPEWPEMLSGLASALDRTGIADWTGEAGHHGGDLAPVLFAFSLSGLGDVGQLVDAFDRLSAMPPAFRGHMLSPARAGVAPIVFALAPWLNERKRGTSGGIVAATAYGRLATLSASWDERDWAVAFEAAAAAIRLECDDATAALQGLETAMATLGQNRWLLRARQRVEFQVREDESAVATVEALGDAFADHSIEAAHLYREGAISAARLGRHELAAHWFEAAASHASRSSLPQLRAMAAGLVADSAAETWRAGRRAEALSGVGNAIERLSGIDPDTCVQSGYVHRIVRNALLWFAREAGMDAIAVDGQPPALPPGAASHPEPDEAILALPLSPLDMARSFLFQVASRAGFPRAVPDPAVGRNGPPILAMEIADRRARLDNAISVSDPAAFVRFLPPAIGAAIAARDHLWPEKPDAWTRGEIVAADLADADASKYAVSATLAFRVVAGALGVSEAAETLRGLLEACPGSLPAGTLDAGFPSGGLPDRGRRKPEHCAAMVGRPDLGTGDLLECSIRILERFYGGDFRQVVEAPVARWAKREWLRFLGPRRFAMSRPNLAAPLVAAAAAAATMTEDFRGLAALTNAAAEGADMLLPLETRAWLREVSVSGSQR